MPKRASPRSLCQTHTMDVCFVPLLSSSPAQAARGVLEMEQRGRDDSKGRLCVLPASCCLSREREPVLSVMKGAGLETSGADLQSITAPRGRPGAPAGAPRHGDWRRRFPRCSPASSAETPRACCGGAEGRKHSGAHPCFRLPPTRSAGPRDGSLLRFGFFCVE